MSYLFFSIQRTEYFIIKMFTRISFRLPSLHFFFFFYTNFSTSTKCKHFLLLSVSNGCKRKIFGFVFVGHIRTLGDLDLNLGLGETVMLDKELRDKNLYISLSNEQNQIVGNVDHNVSTSVRVFDCVAWLHVVSPETESGYFLWKVELGCMAQVKTEAANQCSYLCSYLTWHHLSEIRFDRNILNLFN